MKTKNYFTDKEMCQSYTAESRGIDNTMSEEILTRWHTFRDTILNPLRAEWGSPIVISSGYRCPALNQAVGGVKTSAHLRGEAVDLVPTNGDVSGFFDYTKWWLLRNNIGFDQLIYEHDSKGNWWVHIGYRNRFGFQRGQILNIKKD